MTIDEIKKHLDAHLRQLQEDELDDGESKVMRYQTSNLLADIRNEVEATLAKFTPPSACPFCKTGAWLPTGTKGRLGCSNCNAIGLVGGGALRSIE